ncbi:MAG: SpoIIE family protein phosphatase [Acidimicrobiia bacterium]|nr:SpoIIE family protein phosphatase [Acidimicrobiia bacterium]
MPTPDPASKFDNVVPSLVADIGIGAWHWDPADGSVTWDAAAEAVYGMEPGTFPGTFEGFMERVHPDDRADAVETISTVAATGGDYSIRHRVIRPNGDIRWVEGQGRVILDDAGQPAAGFGIVYDVTDRYTVELERSELIKKEAAARDELRYLIEASDTLTGTLNTERVTERLADLLVPQIGSACAIDVKLDTPIGWILTCAMTDQHDAPALKRGSPNSLINADRRLQGFTTSAGTNLETDLDRIPELPTAGARLRSIPLTSHGIEMGVVTVVLNESVDQATPNGDLLDAICSRAAMALAHAELYADRSRFISIFQSVDTREIPRIPGLEVGTHYRPATDLARLSGDLYDVFTLTDGSWLVAVGDVCGKGAVAAGHAELSRSALRAAALSNSDLLKTLTVLNDVLMGDPTRPMLTLGLLHISIDDGKLSIAAASAGHPPPLVATGDGWSELDTYGTMLGVTSTPTFEPSQIALEPGDVLALYSDGVTEARFGETFYGVDRLGQLIFDSRTAPASAIANDVGGAVDTWATGNPVDDVLALILKAET